MSFAIALGSLLPGRTVKTLNLIFFVQLRASWNQVALKLVERRIGLNPHDRFPF